MGIAKALAAQNGTRPAAAGRVITRPNRVGTDRVPTGLVATPRCEATVGEPAKCREPVAWTGPGPGRNPPSENNRTRELAVAVRRRRGGCRLRRLFALSSSNAAQPPRFLFVVNRRSLLRVFAVTAGSSSNNFTCRTLSRVPPRSASRVLKAIQELEREGKKAAAVFITSPTYHGICSSLSEISELCHSHKIPLVVDEAHGAHLGFHSELPNSALQQGADLTVQSTHKVLSSLTQSSMLHMSSNIVDKEKISRCLQTLQTTSPSYLLLASLDAARAQLSESPDGVFNQAIELAHETKCLLKSIPGISVLENSSFPTFPGIDPLRLTVGFWQLGLSGWEADEILYRDFGIVCELVGSKSITYALNLGTRRDHVQRLISGINHLAATYAHTRQPSQPEDAVFSGHAPFDDIVMRLIPRDAFFASKRKVTIKECVGEISGDLVCPYPPGIPVLIPGEVITETAIDYLLRVRSNGGVISGASDPSLSSITICNV
ncbi:hypothetical protein PIB30_038314 [Stylosanthes scabra]|uniref:Orn/Lys/Arg decarboxylases family 1 pyridoxal-P attachment site domain-containing protein n=1 Tax=Stylosanthes scabra TaxID=79078 RepID=A0ABU6UF94_9FABA|nr:hypothetical protein [Stylosanthes scabra]